ncbi:MAG: HNH endonuclease [Bryobacteraceae bacterium]|nr:HNH endonuclease [Bryobacteraceae bacterium]
MKLVNFASMDPAHRARGVMGLPGHSRSDEQIWNEFQEDWDKMSVLSEGRLQTLQAAMAETPKTHAGTSHSNVSPMMSDGPTEAAATVTVRTMQSFFRKVLLAAYNSRCCITENPVEDLLVASHILPWSQFPKHRLNPTNGLCLAAHFDRAFDRGLITFDSRMRLVISPVLKQYLSTPAIESEFLRREGHPLLHPDRFPPDTEFLDYHRNRIYRGQ